MNDYFPSNLGFRYTDVRLAISVTSSPHHICCKAFDVDGDGHVSPDEIRKILHADPSTTVTEEDIADIVRACDRDGDGQLNWEEVVAAMKH